MQRFADPFRLQRIFAQIERLEQAQGAAHQFVVCEDRSPTGEAFIGEDRDQSMDAVFGPNLVRPAAFRRAVAQPSRLNLGDPHRSEPR